MTDSFPKAKAYALLLIKHRARSEAELRGRLARKGYEEEVVEAVLTEFKKKDLVNDEKFSRLLATQQFLSKPMGKRGLLFQLKRKGVDPSIAQAAVEEAVGVQDEFALALGLAKSRLSRLKGLSPQAFQRRLFGFLSRREFSPEVISKVIRHLSGTLGF